MEARPSTGRDRLAQAITVQATSNARYSDGEESAESDSGEERPHK